MTEDEFVTSSLKQSNLRRTPVRGGVLSVLFKATGPLGADEIRAKLPPHTDAVTVYRTLKTFRQKGVIHGVLGDDRIWRFATGESHQSAVHQHPHFVCDRCGSVECLRHTEIPPKFVTTLKLGRNYTVSYPEVVLHGTCPKCNK